MENSELVYVQSCNIGPKDIVPCVVAGTHLKNEEERLLCPMLWGMIPPWHKVSQGIFIFHETGKN